MSIVRAHINPGVFSWARDSAGYTVEETAKKIGCNPNAVAQWESGAGYPTLTQAKNAARVFGRPVATFYLQQPPEEKNLPDFRVFPGVEEQPQSPNLKRLVRQVMHRCEWAAEVRRLQGEAPLKFVGSVSLAEQSPREVAEQIRREIKTPFDGHEGRGRADELLRRWINKFEDIGVFVFKTDSHPSRAIAIEEMRGLAEANPMAPAIVLNAKDPSKRGQIFTLIHEAAHLWIGRGGVSNMDNAHKLIAKGGEARIEIFCNRVASEFLIPAEEFRQTWDKRQADRDFYGYIDKLRAVFSASGDAIARKAADARLITWEQYLDLHARYVEAWRLAKERQNQRGEPPKVPAYKRLVGQNGRPFARLVLSSYYDGDIHPFTACGLLSANAHRHIDRLADEVL